MTMGPGGGSDPGNAGRGGSSSGRGSTGGGGFGRDTPGSPNAADGKRGSSMGPGGGTAPGRGATGGGGSSLNDTPGAPGNPGRRGQNEAGSTAASRARDAMSRHQRERDVRSIEAGGMSLDDNDGQYGAGLSLTDTVDRQQTENSLNRAGVTDARAMSSADRLGKATEAGAALSETEQQQARGIVAGHTNQFAANRAGDILGAVPGAGLLAGEIAKRSRPQNTMQSHYNDGRQLANDTEMGALGKTAAGFGLGELGVTAPMGVINSAQAIARDSVQNRGVKSLRDSGFGSGSSGSGQASGVGGGSPKTAIAAMSKSPGMTGTRPPGNAFGWSPVDIDRYSRTPLSLARNNRG